MWVFQAPFFVDEVSHVDYQCTHLVSMKHRTYIDEWMDDQIYPSSARRRMRLLYISMYLDGKDRLPKIDHASPLIIQFHFYKWSSSLSCALHFH
jgi:hypothetical protein